MLNRDIKSEDSYIIKYVLPTFADYGYPIGDSEDLRIKGDIKIKMGSSYKEPDIVFYANGIPVLVVESKREGKSQKDAEEQVKSYIRNFPIKKYSRDGRPPQYAAVTIGKRIYFYKYEIDINQYGGIIDRLEQESEILSYDELCRRYGLEEAKKPVVDAESFKDVFYQLIAAFDIKDEKKISREVVLQVVKLLYEFFKDKNNYTSRYPYTDLDKYKDRQRWIRNLLKQFDWSELGKDIADQFRNEIVRAFQGSKQLNQYITPWPVIMFMTALIGVKPIDKVLDFECGSGGFLLAVARKEVTLENLKGVDIDELPYLVTKISLALEFGVSGRDMDNHIPIYNDNGLKNWGSDWDVVISNPAGGSKYELDDLDEVYQYLDDDIDCNNKKDPASEYNFSIQRAIRSARVGGKICLVLPEGVFSNSSDEFLRKYIAKHYRIKAIISLPRGVFYKGTTTKQVQKGKQKSQQKMSILLAEKIKEVKEGKGVSLTDIKIDYPVFLCAIQKPEEKDPEWLEKILERVLEEYKTWQDKNDLLEKNEAIIFSSPDSKKQKSVQQELLKTADDGKNKIKLTKKQKPPTKEETIIPREFDDLF